MKKLQLHQKQQHNAGFSLPEVLVSSALLMMFVGGIAQSQINSVKTISNAGQQNAVQALIAEDINNLRRATFRWQCKADTACTGDPADEDVPMRYDTTQVADACIAGTMAEQMVAAEQKTFPLNKELPWNAEAPQRAQAVTITRSIAAQGNQVDVTYTTSGSSSEITTTTSLVPQALHWCA